MRRTLMRRPGRRAIASVQAAYYLPTATLPFVSRRRFEAMTGPKLEWWLVLTVASQIGVVGAVLAIAARRRPDATEIKLLGAGTAAALGTIDVVYVARRRISPVYLVDAAIQFGLLAAWLLPTHSSAHVAGERR
jgi:hypothetical protein